MSLKRLHFIAHGGVVQGVFFRVHTIATANSHSITGWVMNMPSGKAVEGEAQGTEENLNQFLKAVDKGPPGSHVVRLDTKEMEVKNDEKGFRKVKSYEGRPV